MEYWSKAVIKECSCENFALTFYTYSLFCFLFFFFISDCETVEIYLIKNFLSFLYLDHVKSDLLLRVGIFTGDHNTETTVKSVRYCSGDRAKRVVD